jgi:hypothetical protein
LDARTLEELYSYPAVPLSIGISALSPYRILASLSAFGDDLVIRDVLPVGLPLIAYGCEIRPIGSERVLSEQAVEKLSVSLGQLFPCDTNSSAVRQIMRLVIEQPLQATAATN